MSRGPRLLPAISALLVCGLLGLLGRAEARAHTEDEQVPSPGTLPEPHGPLATSFPMAFDSEWVRLYIQEDTVEVRGTYWLLCRRRLDHPLPLFYPFPQDSLLGGARLVSAQARSGGAAPQSLRVDDLPQAPGVRLWAPPCTADTLRIDAVYRQQARAGYARYVVTTTRAWDRPLRRARFEIHLPRGAHPVGFSFPFRAQESDSGGPYIFEADSFLPDHDIEVRWTR